MRKNIVFIAAIAAARMLASCSKITKNDPWSLQHQKARAKVIFPLG